MNTGCGNLEVSDHCKPAAFSVVIDGNMDVAYSSVRQLIFDNDRNRITTAPNPASDQLTVNIYDNEWIGKEANVYDMTGTFIARFVSSWVSGLYLLRIGDDWSLKFEKQ